MKSPEESLSSTLSSSQAQAVQWPAGLGEKRVRKGKSHFVLRIISGAETGGGNQVMWKISGVLTRKASPVRQRPAWSRGWKAGNSQINVSLEVINLQSSLWGRVVLASSTRITPCPLKGPGLRCDRWVPEQQGHKEHIGAEGFAFCWWKQQSVTACGTGRTGGALAWASLAQSPLPLHLWMQLQSPAGSVQGPTGAGSGRAQGEPESLLRSKPDPDPA